MSDRINGGRPFFWGDSEMIARNELTGMELATYMVLCKYANHKTNTCYPSVDTIAKHLKCSDTSVSKYLESLKELGYIEIKKRKGASSVYTINTYQQYQNKRGSETISEVGSIEVPKPFRKGSPNHFGTTSQTISDKQEEGNNNNINKKKEKSGVLGLGKSNPKETKYEKAFRRIKEENWNDMTPTDWTIYYVSQHENILGNKTDFNPNNGTQVKWFREGFLERFKIPPERTKEYIDTLLTLYRDDPTIQPQYRYKFPLTTFRGGGLFTVDQCMEDVYRRIGRPDVVKKYETQEVEYTQHPLRDEPLQTTPPAHPVEDEDDSWKYEVF